MSVPNSNIKEQFVTIPLKILRDKRLSAQAKLLYAEVKALTKKYGYCFKGNETFAEDYNVSASTIKRWFRELYKFGYLVAENCTGQRKLFGGKAKEEVSKVCKNEPTEGQICTNEGSNMTHPRVKYDPHNKEVEKRSIIEKYKESKSHCRKAPISEKIDDLDFEQKTEPLVAKNLSSLEASKKSSAKKRFQSSEEALDTVQSSGEPQGYYKQLQALYGQFCRNYVGTVSDFAQKPRENGSALSSIAQMLIDTAKIKLGSDASLNALEEFAVNSWKFILGNWETLKRKNTFLGGQVHITQIAKNYTNIIHTYNNGGKQGNNDRKYQPSSEQEIDQLFARYYGTESRSFA